jgi:Uri superfamily endonuclease
LLIEIEAPVAVSIGALGIRHFVAGRYVYTGSAKRNLQARIDRHSRQEKKLHWHIDYLLAHPQVRLCNVETSSITECDWNRSVTGTIPVPGFGASDCRKGCVSHLKFLG